MAKKKTKKENYVYNRDYWRDEHLDNARLELFDINTELLHITDGMIVNSLHNFLAEYINIKSHKELKIKLKELIKNLEEIEWKI